MNRIGKYKTLYLEKQGCVFKESNIFNEGNITSTEIWTDHNEYVGSADLGEIEGNVNFIYKHRLTNLMSINRAKGLPLSETGCNTVSIGFNEKEQAWYGWTRWGYGKFYIGYEIKKGSIMDTKDAKYQYPFKVETLEQAKELAIHIAEYWWQNENYKYFRDKI